MTFVELKAAVALVVQDTSFAAYLGDYLNEVMDEVAEQVDMPSYKTLGTFTTQHFPPIVQGKY
jgi:hypothetical protein